MILQSRRRVPPRQVLRTNLDAALQTMKRAPLDTTDDVAQEVPSDFTPRVVGHHWDVPEAVEQERRVGKRARAKDDLGVIGPDREIRGARGANDLDGDVFSLNPLRRRETDLRHEIFNGGLSSEEKVFSTTWRRFSSLLLLLVQGKKRSWRGKLGETDGRRLSDRGHGERRGIRPVFVCGRDKTVLDALLQTLVNLSLQFLIWFANEVGACDAKQSLGTWEEFGLL